MITVETLVHDTHNGSNARSSGWLVMTVLLSHFKGRLQLLIMIERSVNAGHTEGGQNSILLPQGIQ